VSQELKINFGRSLPEKFGYLVVTAVFMFFISKTFDFVVNNTQPQDYIAQYGLFFTVVGAIIGFIVAQLFIKAHIRSVRKHGVI